MISLLDSKPAHPLTCPYLVSGDAGSAPDLLTLHHWKPKESGQKSKSPGGLGLQMLIRDARGNGRHVAEWLRNARSVARHCELCRHQFVLSSGARSVQELVPGPTMDLILKLCGVEPSCHWKKLNEWLEEKLGGHVTV